MVTILCTCYNHAEYIGKTLEGFVNQKTNFTYKILIHDDASTDNSQEIIREYVNKYPDIIIPIFQLENQYSKGVDLYNEILYPMVKSKYIAFCEGDDYWVDEHKLQKQFEYMESNADCSMCVHNTKRIYAEGNRTAGIVNNSNEEKDYDAVEIIETGAGKICQTSSYFCRMHLITEMPDCYRMKTVGDHPLLIYMAIQGYIHYFPDVMSVYRVCTPNSWTSRQNKSRYKRLLFYRELIDFFTKLNEYTMYEYNEAIERTICKNEYYYNLESFQLKKVMEIKEQKKLFEEEPVINKLKIIIKCCLFKHKKAV